MNAIQKHIYKIALFLALFAIVATSLVSITERSTQQKRIENEQQALLSALNTIVPPSHYTNDLLNDTVQIAADPLLATTEATTAYRARTDKANVAVVYTANAPDGYNGTIKLLIGVNNDGSLAGVRVISHKETPGLGDKIDVRKSDWIKQFSSRSLQNPEPTRWKVKKDGGDFDQFTGATITPRAVIKALKQALLYYQQHQQQLFEQQ